MAVARIIETGITPAQYDHMRGVLGIDSTPPPGGVFHAAALGEDGNVRIFEVWDSREEAEAWGERVAAARADAGFEGALPSIEILEIHSVVAR